MSKPFEIIQKVIEEALSSSAQAQQFLANPTAAFQQGGLMLPEAASPLFAGSAGNAKDPVIRAIEKVSQGNSTPATDFSLHWPTRCEICKYALEGTAVALIAYGAGGLALLSTASIEVAALAAVAGTTVSAALVFIKGLGDVLADGVDAVVTKLCEFVQAC